MAAKMDSRLVVACILIFILNIITFIACQTTQPVGNTTTANAVTTDQTTTTEQTTTIAATTQPPTTTTTPLPTLPPTQVASITDIAPCPCDLTGNACDVNCCCDLDCTPADRDVFTECLESPGSVDNKMCVQKNILLLENAPFSKNYTQDGLFCIYFDNYQERNYYTAPNLVTDETTFNNYVNTYGSFSYQTGTTGQSSIANYYRVGDPVRIVYETLVVGNLQLPRSLSSTACSDSPVAYLRNEESSCVRQITELNTNNCTGTTSFNAQSYYTGFRVVTTPYLFIYIVNGTLVTTTPSTTVTTTTPSPAVSTDNTTETTSVVTPSTTTVTMTTDTNITTTVTIETTEPPTTVPPTQINLYNNSYTIDIGLSGVICRDSAGVQKVCNFPVDTVPAPTYNGATCSNVVKEVEYIITHDATNGISSVNVSFVLQDITTTNLPLSQTFKSSFASVNDVNTTKWSGNPGYVVGKPVRAGIRFVNESFGNRMVIVENGYDLTVVKSTANGDCSTDAGNRVQVNFGQEIRSGCLLSINLDTITTEQYCSYMQDAINLALEGTDDFINANPDLNRYVATFGNSEPEQTGDWVPILEFPGGTVGSPSDSQSCLLSMGMHIQIVYAYVGSVANRQAKILGVAFKYENEQLVTYTCSGSACTPGNAGVDQRFEISQSVSFIDVTEPATGAVGDAPVFIAKVPNDFFYPFGTGASNSLRHSVAVTISMALLACFVRFCL